MEVNMDWRKSRVFGKTPEEILQMGLYELYALLGVNNTRNDLADGTRNLLEAVTFDFLAANELSPEDAQSWIRQDIQDLRGEMPRETDGSALQVFLTTYVSAAMTLGYPRASQALAVAVRGAEVQHTSSAQGLRKLFSNAVAARDSNIPEGSVSYGRELALLLRNINRKLLGLPDACP
jgi:hypothetical protein